MNRGEVHGSVLIVDDEDSTLKALKRILRNKSYSIHTATNGEEAIPMLAERDIWVIISDNHMPGIGGIRFLEEARLARPDTVRILLTGHADLQSAKDAVNHGGIAYLLTKPWDPQELRTLVQNAIHKRRLAEVKRQTRSSANRGSRQLMPLTERLIIATEDWEEEAI